MNIPFPHEPQQSINVNVLHRNAKRMSSRPSACFATACFATAFAYNTKKKTKLRELRRVFDALDEHGDGGIGRDDLLSSLDLDHPHLMALLRDSPAAAAAIDAGGGGAAAGTGAGGTSWSAVTGRNESRGGKQQQQQQQRGAAMGPAMLSAFDVIEASDDEYITWDEVCVCFTACNILPGVFKRYIHQVDSY